MSNRWYAVQTYAGQESKVVQFVQEFIDNGDLGEMITKVICPTQDVIQVKNGKKVKTTRKFFPSYVLIETDLSKEAQHFVLSINGVMGFVGQIEGKNSRPPQPLREEEVRRILGQAEKQAVAPVISEIPFVVGDAVKIKEGPFKDFDGTVDEVYPDKGKIKVMVSVFGRSTPVEVDFVHVTPIS